MVGIIFICNANMCRSAMAEGILKKRLLEHNLSRIKVASMGIHGIEGNAATENAIKICGEASIDISKHASRPLVPEELKASRLILAMEAVQVDYIDIFFPQVADRLYMLGTWPERKKKKADIDDPVGKSIGAYRKIFKLLQRHIDRLLPELQERFSN